MREERKEEEASQTCHGEVKLKESQCWKSLSLSLSLLLSFSLSLSPSPECCCPTESTARPTPVYYYLFKPMDSTCTASTLMNWFAVWEAREASEGWHDAAGLPSWRIVGVWENAFLLGKGGL